MGRVLIFFCWVALACNVAAADHEFRYKAPDASSVQLMGEFNFWKGQSALRWFLAQSPNSSQGSPSPPSDFDKFFKKP
jgi:hypothetical protein